MKNITCTIILGTLLGTSMAFAQEGTPKPGPNPVKTTTPPAPEKPAEDAPKEIKAEVGKPAPNFSLKDTKGKLHNLSDYSGRYVVIEWFNPGCPYCRGIYSEGIVEDTRKKMKSVDIDAVYLAINSTANQPEEFIVTQSDTFLEKQEQTDIPVLMDYDGSVGRLYEAKKTPHMYVIDPKGNLIYSGAITDDQNFERGSKATNYVINAARQSASGETVSPSAVRSWGCGVKYADGGERKGGKRKGGRRNP